MALENASPHQHRQKAGERGPIGVGVVTVSDSRTEQTDVNGQYLQVEIEKKGHRQSYYQIIPDDPEQIAKALGQAQDAGSEVIVFNGGTGISRRDTTYDVLEGQLEKVLPGFGELFRMLSFEQVGTAAMFSRALAGVYKGVVVISIPGSPAAVRLAWTQMISPELEHLAWEVGR